MLLKINNLTIQYGKAEVIKGLSLEVSEKEIITIIGANGAGKTTVLRAISGLKPPASGDIWFRHHRQAVQGADHSHVRTDRVCAGAAPGL